MRMSRGFGIYEVIIAVGVGSVLMLSIGKVITDSLASQNRALTFIHLTSMSRDMMRALSYDQGWANTIEAGSTGGSHVAGKLQCLKGGTPCTADGTAAGAPISQQTFALFDTSNNLVFDATNPNNGLDRHGALCNTFSESGNDACPFRYDLKWTALCAPGNCVRPQIKVSANLLYRPATNPIFIRTESYSLQLVYKSAPPTATGPCTPIFLTDTSQSEWTVPSDWSPTNNSIEVIGGGGGGASSRLGGAGGGGGGYSKVTNVTLTPGSKVAYRVGIGGPQAPQGGGVRNGSPGGDTFFCNSLLNCASITGSAVVVGAKGGGGGRYRTPSDFSAGGTAGDAAQGVGTVKFSGGKAGDVQSSNILAGNNLGGSGGGGAAGPNGDGGSTDSRHVATPMPGSNGGNGGASSGGLGGAGTNGNSAPGMPGTEWDPLHGSGGGGGGGGLGGRHDFTAGGGGLYGGGGGGMNSSQLVMGSDGGAGAQGLIVIKYCN